MTALEMHIELEQGLQALASSIKRSLQPEEKDWLLNKAVERFILSKMKPLPQTDPYQEIRYEIDQSQLEMLESIVTSRIVSTTRSRQESALDIYTVSLPSDKFFLLSDTSYVYDPICSGQEPTQSSINKVYMSLPIIPGNAPFYHSVKIEDEGQIVFDLSDYTTTFLGLSDKEESFIIRDILLYYLRKKGYEVYWEEVDGFYNKDCLIFILTVAHTIRALVDEGISLGSVISTVTGSNFSGNPEDLIPNRLIRTQVLRDVLRTTFYKPIKISPVSSLYRNHLEVFTDKSFIVSKIEFRYVRIPRKISLKLNENCDLPQKAHQVICDLAVEIAKNEIADPTYQLKKEDNLTRVGE